MIAKIKAIMEHFKKLVGNYSAPDLPEALRTLHGLFSLTSHDSLPGACCHRPPSAAKETKAQKARDLSKVIWGTHGGWNSSPYSPLQSCSLTLLVTLALVPFFFFF